MKSHIEYKKIKRGYITKLIKKKTLRDDIPCHIKECAICEGNLKELNLETPILFLTADLIVNQIDAIENFPIIDNCIIPQSEYNIIIQNRNNESVFKTLSFKEKPDLHTAKEYLAKGNYFWNSGMFSFTIGTYLSELAKYAPKISKLLKPGYDEIFDNFSAMPDISIDYAVAEKSEVGVTIPLNLNWNDVGSWDAIYEIMEKDENNNAVKGDVIAIDSRETLFFGKNRLIAGIGVRNLMVVDTDDVVVVCHRGDSQKVKDLVGILKADDRREPFEIVKKLVE